MTKNLLTMLAVLVLQGKLIAAAPEIIEVSGSGNRINAIIAFFDADGSALASATMQAQRFQWFTVPATAESFDIIVGAVSSGKTPLQAGGNTVISIRGLNTQTLADGSTKVSLNFASRVKPTAPAGQTGIVFFGQLEAPYGPDAQWASLYMVTKDTRGMPDVDNDGTKRAVEDFVSGKEMYVDFPLYLRQWDEALKQPAKAENDPVIRAGQLVKVTGFTPPDLEGNVYAKVTVVAP